ncbi:MAG TPA: flagellar biosynthesis protein FliQ [Solirubrobacteraceae bacterium]|nr:flagellar biosynthesis protein FliQ [Solirubrobacteraceae bacterium]
MNQDTVISLATQAMTLAVEVAGPVLLAGLVIGLLVSIFQAVTSIQEQTLTFIPKIIAVAVIIVVLGPWMLRQIVDYTDNLYQSIPTLIAGA